MRAATQLVLVLMGGGALTGGVAASMESGRAWGEARARQDPRAEEICRSHGGGYFHSAHLWSGGWFGGNRSAGLFSGVNYSTTDPHGVSRGGFGLFGLHFGGFHG